MNLALLNAKKNRPMKLSRFTESDLRQNQIAGRFPLTDWSYHSVDLSDFTARGASKPRFSFTQISRDYFNSEARRNLILECVFFAVISITIVPAILDCGRALLEFTHATGVM